jgi:two-component system, NtrC family, response regulator AtoC
MDGASPLSSEMSKAPALQGNLTVLLVDDDDAFRRGLADNLREDGHTVLEYGGPDDIPQATFGNLNVVVTDYDMPGTNGLRFADRVHAARPSLPIVMLTASRQAAFVIEAAARSFVHLVYKPVVYQRLHQLLCALVGDPTRQ